VTWSHFSYSLITNAMPFSNVSVARQEKLWQLRPGKLYKILFLCSWWGGAVFEVFLNLPRCSWNYKNQIPDITFLVARFSRNFIDTLPCMKYIVRVAAMFLIYFLTCCFVCLQYTLHSTYLRSFTYTLSFVYCKPIIKL